VSKPNAKPLLVRARLWGENFKNGSWGNIDSDREVFSWPWQMFALGKFNRPLSVTSNRYITVKNTLGCKCSRVSCVWDNIVTFCSVFVTTVVHKSNFRLVINKTPNKWWPLVRSCNDGDSCFWHDLYVGPQPSSRVLRDSTHAVKVNCILLSKRL
jgi:hypothetical protein